jgi:hypothetical protein
MRYELTRFSTQSFEQFIQTLAIAVAGPAVQIFGAGRDGAREATFRGHCQIGAAEWDGYVVFQAKYRAEEESPAKNADWLIKQIDEEFKKFEDARRGLATPEYYVMASNVRLSASAADAKGKGAGGIDRVTARLTHWRKKLGMKDVLLWHAETLAGLLDVHASVRDAYAFWVQPSDILAELLRKLQGPDKQDILTSFLRSGIKQAREIKTRDIGQAASRIVTIDEVFVDLPTCSSSFDLASEDIDWVATLSGDDEPEDDEVEDNQLQISFEQTSSSALQLGVVAQLFQRASNKFDFRRADEGDKVQCRHSEIEPNRVLLLGGPGQGKSTVGQFVAQLCRARILSELKVAQTPEINDIVRNVLERALSENIPMSGPLRYPLHVELPLFADALAKARKDGGNLTIAAHLAKSISEYADCAVDSTTLRDWLRALPAILILDGLDEVPHSGNRTDVIVAIEEFLETIHAANIDCLVLATSRPQGYQDELSRKYWAHWELGALGSGDAMHLASRIAPVLIAETRRRTEVLEILANAAKEETTAPLMTSPLQVMLLFQLVSTHDNIPEDRWTLFRRHYETLRNREISKGGPSGTTIRRFKTQIDRIHYDAGLILQVRAEQEGAANPFLTVEEFSGLVSRHLADDGHENIEVLTADIVEIATDRLVFLRCHVDGQISFDVRSLQEFMAAARITSSPEDLIKDRLRGIAGRAHWLHVFKIVCSKIFASTGHEALRDPVIALLDSLDRGDRDPDDRLVRTGARIALQLLLDGTAGASPKYRQLLAIRSLELLAVADVNLILALARALNGSSMSHIEPPLLEALIGTDPFVALNAAKLLARIVCIGKKTASDWATQLIADHLQATGYSLLQMMDDIRLIPDAGPLRVGLRDAQWAVSPLTAQFWGSGLEQEEDDETGVAEDLPVLRWSRASISCPLKLATGTGSQDLLFSVVPIDAIIEVKAPPENAHPLWPTMVSLAAFASSPGSLEAAAFIRALGRSGAFEELDPTRLPWVLAASVAGLDMPEEFEARATAFEAGTHGTLADWRAAEGRWRAGICQDELIDPGSSNGVSANIGLSGGPYLFARRLQRATGDAMEEVIDLFERMPDNTTAEITFEAYFRRARRKMPPRAKKLLLKMVERGGERSELRRSNLIAALLSCIQTVGDQAQILATVEKMLPVRRSPPIDMNFSPEPIWAAFNADPRRRKLLILLAGLPRRTLDRHVHAFDKTAFETFPSDGDEIAASVGVLRSALDSSDWSAAETAKLLVRSTLSPIGSILRGQFGQTITPQTRLISLEVARLLTMSRGRLHYVARDQLKNHVEAISAHWDDSDRTEKLQLPHLAN